MIKGRLGSSFTNYSSDWEYVVGDTMTTITRYIGSNTRVQVPEKIEGKPVQIQGNSTFMENYDIREVTIPNSVTFSNNGDASAAFQSCTNLATITIPNGTTNLAGAFAGCYNLYPNNWSNFFPNSVTDLSSCFSGTVSQYVYNLVLPNNTTNISSMFDESYDTTIAGAPVSIPDKVIDMSSFFYYGYSIDCPISIGSNVKNIAYAFYGLSDTFYSTFSSYWPNVTNAEYAFSSTYFSNGGQDVYINAPKLINGQGMFEWSYFRYGTSFKLNAPNMTNFYAGLYGDWNEDIERAYIYAPKATNLSSAFTYRVGLTNISGVFSNATDISSMCQYCPQLQNTIYTPNAINMYATYRECYSLKNATFPSKVQDISETYAYCESLNKIQNIPNTVTNMYGTFRYCSDFSGDIFVDSTEITDFTDCFDGTSLPKAVYINSSTNSWYAAQEQINGQNGVIVFDRKYTEDNTAFNSNFTYEETSDKIIITNYKGSGTTAFIPSRFNGKQVYLGAGSYTYDSYYGETTINSPFANKTNLQYLYISPGVESMGGAMTYMFYNCRNLKEVPFLPNGTMDLSHAFEYCYNLITAPYLSNSITNMTNTFYYCSNLTGIVNIPGSVMNLHNTFYSCPNISNVTLAEGIQNMAYAFSGASFLTNFTGTIRIPNSVQSLAYAFSGTNIKSVYISNYAQISNMRNAFVGCNSLTTAPNIPYTTTDMMYCFRGCNGLTKAPNIPSNVVNMQYAFAYCTNMTTGPSTFSGGVNLSYCFQNCNSLNSSITLPTTMTSGNYMFANCTAFNKPITVPNGANTYFYSAFMNCKALNSRINIGNNVQNMASMLINCWAYRNSVYVYSNTLTTYAIAYVFNNTSSNGTTSGTNGSKQIYVYPGTTTNTSVHNSYARMSGYWGCTVYNIT